VKPIRIAVLVSGHGRGSNMQAIIDACKDGRINGEVAVVIGVKSDAPAIDRAKASGVEPIVINPKEYECIKCYDSAMLEALTSRQINLICLAGYMRVLGQPIIDAFRNRILNVHPALIPMFCGKGMYGRHVHEAAIARGVKFSGCTVHLVDEEYDSGPIVLQTVVPVLDGDTPEVLAARILPEEHKTYVNAIQLFAENKIEVVGRRIKLKT
jgi:formyltetrahydrofolate-dependent phosphoribosylglycinamide formyltransferase